MPFSVDRQPLRSAAMLLRGGVGLGVSIACMWYLMRAGLLRAHLPQILALPENAGEWMMPMAIAAMLACARGIALLPRATRLSRVHDAALAALLLPLVGLMPGLGLHGTGIGLLFGTLAVAGAALLLHGWGLRLAALSGLDAALCFAMAAVVAESVLALSLSGLGGETAWLALGVGLPMLSRLLLGNLTLPEATGGRAPAPLRPLPASLLAALFLASAACGLFYQLLDQLPPESDATVMASSAVFCGVALCAAILLRVQPSVAPRHLFRLALPLLGLGFATLMLLGQRMPRVPMFIQLAGSALLDVFMYASLLHSAGLHAGRNRARIVALYWALLFGSQWAGSLLFLGLGMLLPQDIAHIQVLSLAAVCAIISIMLVVRPDPATYMGWRLPGHVPDHAGAEAGAVCSDNDAECDDDAALRTILSDLSGGAAGTTPPASAPSAPAAAGGRHAPVPVGADGAELPVPRQLGLHGAGRPADAPVPAPAPATPPLPPNPPHGPSSRPAMLSEAAPRTYPSAPPAECLADSLRRMGLTRQQVAVTLLLADHHSGPEICDRLNISYNTLKTHVRNIYRQLGVGNQQELRNAVTRFDPAGPDS
ncbi:helix-turn-helix transcriptional regulator [Nitratidesulfovibrio sp. D1]|uniref:helix-turn-helix transcriptional regulator n=1 Tax=Nitratidesulfovibrio sp. D1 TaxID=3440151 RepID=UPI003EB74799